MDDTLAIFLLMAVAIGAAVVLTLVTSWMRANHRSAAKPAIDGGAAETFERLSSENDQLKAEVSRLAARVEVLEPLAPHAAQAAEPLR
jgi:hypothetical protein